MPVAYRFWKDPLWWCACVAYVVNRFIAMQSVGGAFLRGHFNDIWFIPAALPPVLWMQSLLRLRPSGAPPSTVEIGLHWLAWSVIAEGIAPLIMPHCVADLRDVAAYAIGALIAGLWWRQRYYPLNA